MNKKLAFTAILALGIAGTVQAQMGMQDPYGDATVAKTDAATQDAARFDALDANKDGKIDAGEIEAATQGRGGRGLMRADADGDGAVSKDEFLAQGAQRFERMDADKDGQLTKAERDEFRAQMMQRFGGGGAGAGGAPQNR